MKASSFKNIVEAVLLLIIVSTSTALISDQLKTLRWFSSAFPDFSKVAEFNTDFKDKFKIENGEIFIPIKKDIPMYNEPAFWSYAVDPPESIVDAKMVNDKNVNIDYKFFLRTGRSKIIVYGIDDMVRGNIEITIYNSQTRKRYTKTERVITLFR